MQLPTTNQPEEPQELKQVMREILELRDRTQHTEAVVAALYNRLSPLMYPPTTTAPRDGQDARESLVPLAEAIREISERVYLLTDRLGTLLHCIEL